MTYTLDWSEIAVRLGWTVVAGVLLGLNRSERGRAAGLRTNLLVCLAASVAMIQANLLLPTDGKTPESFSVLDLMRLPLGILTGMGFIGAGAVLRKGDAIRGVTTAAVLWTDTVIGLCFGGGQYRLGLAALAIALVALWGLQPVEGWLRRERRATLTVRVIGGYSVADGVCSALAEAGYQAVPGAVMYGGEGDGRRVHTARYEVTWRSRYPSQGPLMVLDQLARRQGVLSLKWKPEPA